MILISTGIEEKGPTPRKYAKQLKQANLESARELGEHFHNVNMPRRFTTAGGIMLGYAARKPGYQKKKRKKTGQNEPNVFTGQTKKAVLMTEDIRVSGSSKRWTVSDVFSQARFLNQYGGVGRIKPAEEIRRVATKEIGPLVRFFEQSHQRKIDEIK
jgi:ADP-heptose:LPS heptosyltransferase